MRDKLVRFKKVVTVVIIFAFVMPITVISQPTANLSFQADIYGSTSPETLEYVSDFNFYNWGGFGVNSHVFRARLRSGDQVAYAVSASDPYAFTLQTQVGSGEPITLTVTNNEYSSGIVSMPSPSELHFTWEIEESGLHLRIHRYATLVQKPDVTVQNIIRENFSIENLGVSFILKTFSEYLHMDDRARVRDYDSDGRFDTLLAINDFSTSWYPIFGKVYLNRPNIDTDLISDGRYAQVNHNLNLPIANDVEVEIAKAAYVSSTARNGTDAEQQVANDAHLLLVEEDRITLQYPFQVSSDPDDVDSILGEIRSYFDHEYPTYSGFPNNQPSAIGNITPYWGDRRGAGTAKICDNSQNSNTVCYDGHDGYDFSVTEEIFAAADGRVSYAGCYYQSQNPPGDGLPCTGNRNRTNDCSAGLGCMIRIEHSNGYETTYGHLSTISVTMDITVTSGITIGVAGNTGNVTGENGGVHLHFQLERNGNKVDPYGWIPGEVRLDPLTQPITNTVTGLVYQGVPSYCLWESGCPTSNWINPDEETTLNSEDGSVELRIPSGALTGLTNFHIVHALDNLGDSQAVPTGYSFSVRASDTLGTPVSSFPISLTLSIVYSEDVISYAHENSLQIYHWNSINSEWEPLVTSLDTTNNVASTTLVSLSLFSLRGEPINPAPVVLSVNPSSISNLWSNTLTINGLNFLENSRVWLGISPLKTTYSDSSKLFAKIPARYPAGSYSISVVNPDYQLGDLENGLEVGTMDTLYLPFINR